MLLLNYVSVCKFNFSWYVFRSMINTTQSSKHVFGPVFGLCFKIKRTVLLLNLITVLMRLLLKSLDSSVTHTLQLSTNKSSKFWTVHVNKGAFCLYRCLHSEVFVETDILPAGLPLKKMVLWEVPSQVTQEVLLKNL